MHKRMCTLEQISEESIQPYIVRAKKDLKPLVELGIMTANHVMLAILGGLDKSYKPLVDDLQLRVGPRSTNPIKFKEFTAALVAEESKLIIQP